MAFGDFADDQYGGAWSSGPEGSPVDTFGSVSGGVTSGHQGGFGVGNDSGSPGPADLVFGALRGMAPQVIGGMIPGLGGSFAGGALRGALAPSAGSSPFGSAADVMRGMVPSMLGGAMGGPFGALAGAAFGGMMNQLAADPNAEIGSSTPLGTGESDPFIEAAEAEIRRDPPAVLTRTLRTKGMAAAERMRRKLIIERARKAEKAASKASRRLRT